MSDSETLLRRVTAQAVIIEFVQNNRYLTDKYRDQLMSRAAADDEFADGLAKILLSICSITVRRRLANEFTELPDV